MIVFLNIAAVAWLVGVVVGYLLGRLDVLTRGSRSDHADPGPQSFIAKTRSGPAPAAARIAVSIDEKKFVAPINTSGMARNEKIELGKTTEIADDINSSVSKLAQLKGK
jgi:hypothetical protein